MFYFCNKNNTWFSCSYFVMWFLKVCQHVVLLGSWGKNNEWCKYSTHLLKRNIKQFVSRYQDSAALRRSIPDRLLWLFISTTGLMLLILLFNHLGFKSLTETATLKLKEIGARILDNPVAFKAQVIAINWKQLDISFIFDRGASFIEVLTINLEVTHNFQIQTLNVNWNLLLHSLTFKIPLQQRNIAKYCSWMGQRLSK